MSHQHRTGLLRVELLQVKLLCCDRWLPTDDAEMVIELMPSSPDGYYHKGFALFQLQDYTAAMSSTQNDSWIANYKYYLLR